jgi:hypothetical protein
VIKFGTLLASMVHHITAVNVHVLKRGEREKSHLDAKWQGKDKLAIQRNTL